MRIEYLGSYASGQGHNHGQTSIALYNNLKAAGAKELDQTSRKGNKKCDCMACTILLQQHPKSRPQ